MRDRGGGERDRGAPGPGGLFPLSVTLRMQRKLDGLKLPNITYNVSVKWVNVNHVIFL